MLGALCIAPQRPKAARNGRSRRACAQGELKNGMTKLEHMLAAVHSNEDALVLLAHLFPHVKAGLTGERLARLREAARSHQRNPAVQARSCHAHGVAPCSRSRA